MFDYVTCSAKLPGNPPKFIEAGHEFQTKDLDCTLDTYEITAEGMLMNGPNVVPYTGSVEFYSSNILGGHMGMMFTKNGEPWECAGYLATFDAGRLREIVATECSTGPALPISELHSSLQEPPPTNQELAARKSRESASYLGRTMFKMSGCATPDEGYEVEVVAEGKRTLVLSTPNAPFNQEFEIEYRSQLDSTLFDSKEAAAVYYEQRSREQREDRERYDRLLKASAPS